MKKALLLIDVQRHYVTKRHERHMLYIDKLIGEFSKRKLPILNLVYDDPFGLSVVGSVRKKLEEANGVWHFSKLQSNGAKEVISILSLRGLEPGKATIEVCGFYTNLCVLQTVSSLFEVGHKIVVHNAGTGATSKSAQTSSISRMKKLGIEILDEDNSVG